MSLALILGAVAFSVYQGWSIVSGQGTAALRQVLLPAFAILALVRPSWAVVVYSGFRALPDISVADLTGLNLVTLGTLTLAFAAVMRLVVTRRRIPASPLWLPMLSMYSMFWVSAFYYAGSWGMPQMQAVKDLVGMMSAPILFLYIMGSDLQRRDALFILRGLILLWFVTAGQVVLLGTSIPSYLRDHPGSYVYVARAFTIDAAYPSTLIIALSMALAGLRLAPVELARWRWLLSFLLGGGVVALFLSSYTSALAAALLAFGTVLYLTRSLGGRRESVARYVLVALIFMVFLRPFVPTVSVVANKLIRRVAPEASWIQSPYIFSTRLTYMWPQTWAQFLRHPLFGAGLSFSYEVEGGAHNFYLHSLAKFGLIGAAVTATFLVTLLRFLRRCLRSFGSDPFWAMIAAGTFAGVLGNLSFYIFHDAFLGPWFDTIYILAALLTAATKQTPHTEGNGSMSVIIERQRSL